MDVSLWVWLALIVGILAMLAVDLLMHRDAHVVSVCEAGRQSPSIRSPRFSR